MKMSGRVTSCWVFLLFALTSVSAVQILNSINDLKKINFGSSVPKHSLVLLHWFANAIDIRSTDDIRLTFNPDNGDYGSHHYGNFENMLDLLPRGSRYRYFTIGNLYQETSVPLPSYVVNSPRGYEGRNRDRIIIRIREQYTGLQWIDQVYITQHYETFEDQGTIYDQHHTYQISTNLLRQIREFSVAQNQIPVTHLINRFGSNADEFFIRNTWGNLACLGLLLFIVIEEKYRPQNNNRPNNTRLQNSQTHSSDNVSGICMALMVLVITILLLILARTIFVKS